LGVHFSSKWLIGLLGLSEVITLDKSFLLLISPNIIRKEDSMLSFAPASTETNTEIRFTNCKLSSDIINSMAINPSISSAQIDVLLWIARRQDAFGRVFYVKYSEVCKDIGISHQEYYNCIQSLVDENIIRVINRHNRYGWDFEILNNAFIGSEDDKDRYLNINRNFLFSKAFIGLRSNEKKLILKILLEKIEGKEFYLFISTVTKWTGIKNRQLIRSYLDKLKTFFTVSFFTKGKNNRNKSYKHKDRQGCVLQDDVISLNFHKNSEFEHVYKHKIKTLCRNMKIFVSGEHLIDDVIILMQQYMNHVHLSVIYNIIVGSLEKHNEIRPRYINWKINNYIDTSTI